jgi:hypothetical protein
MTLVIKRDKVPDTACPESKISSIAFVVIIGLVCLIKGKLAQHLTAFVTLLGNP